MGIDRPTKSFERTRLQLLAEHQSLHLVALRCHLTTMATNRDAAIPGTGVECSTWIQENGETLCGVSSVCTSSRRAPVPYSRRCRYPTTISAEKAEGRPCHPNV